MLVMAGGGWPKSRAVQAEEGQRTAELRAAVARLGPEQARAAGAAQPAGGRAGGRGPVVHGSSWRASPRSKQMAQAVLPAIQPGAARGAEQRAGARAALAGKGAAAAGIAAGGGGSGGCGEGQGACDVGGAGGDDCAEPGRVACHTRHVAWPAAAAAARQVPAGGAKPTAGHLGRPDAGALGGSAAHLFERKSGKRVAARLGQFRHGDRRGAGRHCEYMRGRVSRHGHVAAKR